MAKKMNNNTFEFKGISYTLTNRVRDKSEVRDVVYSIESYVKAVDEGKICRDPLIQRTDDQWSRKQRSKFIEAILRDRPIGSITTAKGRAESRNYRITSLIDGLQRTTAIVDYVHDRFALDKKAQPILCKFEDSEGNEIEEYLEISGKRFSQLPDAIKDFFNSYTIITYLYENFSDDELDDIVYCMNNGKTPTSYQKIRFLLGSENMRYLQPICDSTLWEDNRNCKAKNDSILCCVIRTLMMLSNLKNRCEELIVEQHAIVYKFDYTSIMYFLEMLSVSEYERYKKIHNIFNENIMDWIKSKLRARMMNLSGDFIKDAIKEDTYFQVRKNNNSKDVYYIIYRWWEKGIDKDISFIDIINDGTLFVGEND